MRYRLTNNAVGVLAASIDDNDVSLVVSGSEGALFPSLSTPGDVAMATVVDADGNFEIVKITARSTNTMTIERGQEGTTPRAFAGGSKIELRMTAGVVESFIQHDDDNQFSGDQQYIKSGADGTYGYELDATFAALFPFTFDDILAWMLQVDEDSYGVARYDSSGNFVDFPLLIDRETGDVAFTHDVAIDGDLAVAGAITQDGVRVDAFAPGTRMLFQQTAAPTGWIKVTTHNNKALRIVSGTVGNGGSLDFTTAFGARSLSGTVGGHAITILEMPLHGHSYRVANPSDTNNQRGALAVSDASAVNRPAFTGTPSEATGEQIGGTGGGQAHTHSLTMNNLDMAVAYVDVIIAVKDEAE